jgi:plastocyanin
MRGRLSRAVAIAALACLALLSPTDAGAAAKARPIVVTLSAHGASPQLLRITPGTTVTFRNGAPRPARVVGEQGTFDSGSLAPRGGTFTFTFTKPGRIQYAVTGKPARRGVVAVRAAVDSDVDPALYLGKGDRFNCDDFPSQAAAQAVLRADPSDSNRLDRDHDGVACETNQGPFDRTKVSRSSGTISS